MTTGLIQTLSRPQLSLACVVTFLLGMIGGVAADVTLNLDVTTLHADTAGSLCPSNSTAVLLVSTANNSFGDLTFAANSALADLQFTAEADDRVVATFPVGQNGVFQNAVTFDITAPVSPNDSLLFVWYPNLPFNANRLGPGQGQRFGTYRSDAATQGSDSGWQVPADGTGLNLAAISVSAGGDTADAQLVAPFFTAGQTNRSPTAQCQTVTKPAGPDCQATISPAEVNNGSSDPDNDPLTFSLSPTGPFPIGTNLVTLTVADNRGGSDSCLATVIVFMASPPVLVCPSDINRSVATGVTSTVVNFPALTGSNNCGFASVDFTPASGSTFGLGTTPVICTAIAGTTNTCSFNVTVTTGGTNDLAVIDVRPPKTIKLTAQRPTATKLVRVTIQNLAPHSETISNLTGVVDLQVLALANCPNLIPALMPGKLPVTLKPNQKLKVSFQVTFSTNCIPDARKSFADYRYVATVHHTAIDGNPDTNPPNDTLEGTIRTDVTGSGF
ncbi:MAG: HYR domain-containing protein [Verrucomicrobiota bacterium]